MKDLMCNQYDKIEELGYNDDEFFEEYFRLYDMLPWYDKTLCFFTLFEEDHLVYLKAVEKDSWVRIILGCRKCFGASSL